MKLPLFLLSSVAPHSWIACTDYGEKNGRYYDVDKCRAWPRRAWDLVPKTSEFGEGGTGFANAVADDESPCKAVRDENDGKNGHFEAVYFPGQEVVIAHPSQNHMIGPCKKNFSKLMADNGNYVLHSGQGATAKNQVDPTLGEFKQNVLADLGVSPTGQNGPHDEEVYLTFPKPGYQNAPGFCENMDRALGTYSFEIPADMAPGEYTFAWLWKFRNKDQYSGQYTTCWEVTIVDSKAKRDITLMKRNQSTYLPCNDELLSNGQNSTLAGCSVNGDEDILEPAAAQMTPSEFTGTISLTKYNGAVAREIIVAFPDIQTFPTLCQIAVHINNGQLDSKSTTNGDLTLVIYQTTSADLESEKLHFGLFFDDGCSVNHIPEPVIQVIELDSAE